MHLLTREALSNFKIYRLLYYIKSLKLKEVLLLFYYTKLIEIFNSQTTFFARFAHHQRGSE
jgi:hypothetical protein